MLIQVGVHMTISLLSIVYLLIAILVFRASYIMNEDLKQRKHYKKHPERYGVMPTWALVLVAALWPLQIIGVFIYLLRGY